MVVAEKMALQWDLSGLGTAAAANHRLGGNVQGRGPSLNLFHRCRVVTRQKVNTSGAFHSAGRDYRVMIHVEASFWCSS
jgi:hypothetical protein